MATGDRGASSSSPGDFSAESFTALCFGPGLRPEGERIAARLDGEGLCLWPGEAREQRVPYRALQVAAGGFDHEQMILSWNPGGEWWSLTLSNKPGKDFLLAHAPPALEPQLAHWKKKICAGRHRMRLGWTVLALFLLAPFLLLAVFLWQTDRIVDWAASRISVQDEQKLGELIFEQTRPSLKLITEGEAPRVIEQIGRKLTAGTPYAFKWHVADDPAINAFAIPGGHVVVFTGLIKAADSAEEVAGVLAHEAEHVLQRHSLKSMIHNLGWRAAIAVATGDWTGGLASELAAQMGILKFGRDKESEADLKGLDLLRKAHIAPEGMVSFFDKLSKQGGAPIALLSTHPASADRMAALRSAIAKNGSWQSQPSPYDWTNVKATLPTK